MSEVITEHQNAFIKGRQILNSVLIANEVLTYIEKKKGKAYLFKLDFHKAFDFVLWEYINEVMASMGFGRRWRGWIMLHLNGKDACACQWISHGGIQLGKRLTPRRSSLSFSLQYCSLGFELYVAAWL
jgi:hypothetical protein